MKTVQEWLKDLDRGKLLDVYASRHPLHATDTVREPQLSGAADSAKGSAEPGHR